MSRARGAAAVECALQPGATWANAGRRRDVPGWRSRRNPTRDGPGSRGFGCSPENLRLSPLTYELRGEAGWGSKNAVLISIKNCGASNGEPLHIQALEMVALARPGPVAGEDQFSVAPVALPKTLLAGEELVVKAFYEPIRDGEAAGTLNLRSTGYGSDLVRIELAGRARVYPACQLAITPGRLDFGTVTPGNWRGARGEDPEHRH